MSKRAEELALKAYPEKDALNKKATGHYDPNYPRRKAYQQGYEQGAKEERESLSHTMLTYAADVFSGKMLPEDISYSYRQELADYFRDLARKTLTQIKAREE